MNRERSSFNLIVYNVHEADRGFMDESPTSTGTDLVKSIIQSIQPSEYNNFKTARLGKKIQGRIRPIRVTLPFKSDVTTILRNNEK